MFFHFRILVATHLSELLFQLSETVGNLAVKSGQELVKIVSLDIVYDNFKTAIIRLTLKGGAILEGVSLACHRNEEGYTKLTEPGGKPRSAPKPLPVRSSEAEN